MGGWIGLGCEVSPRGGRSEGACGLHHRSRVSSRNTSTCCGQWRHQHHCERHAEVQDGASVSRRLAEQGFPAILPGFSGFKEEGTSLQPLGDGRKVICGTSTGRVAVFSPWTVDKTHAWFSGSAQAHRGSIDAMVSLDDQSVVTGLFRLISPAPFLSGVCDRVCGWRPTRSKIRSESSARSGRSPQGL